MPPGKGLSTQYTNTQTGITRQDPVQQSSSSHLPLTNTSNSTLLPKSLQPPLATPNTQLGNLDNQINVQSRLTLPITLKAEHRQYIEGCVEKYTAANGSSSFNKISYRR